MTAGDGIDITLELGAFSLRAALAVPARGVTAVLGPSGAGKSTLLRCLAGLEPAARGRIEIDGEVWLDTARGIVRPPHRRRVGFVFQDSALFPHLSVRRNIEYGLRRRPPGAQGVCFDEAVAWLQIGALLERSPARLSGGERQRVAIARALLRGPRMLLFDEPLASLDAGARDEIVALLRDLLGRTPVPALYVTHRRSEALQLADHVVLLEGGRVQRAGSVGAMALAPESERFSSSDELGVVLDTTVTAVDERDALSTLVFAGGALAVPGRLPIGERRRLEVRARDVSLALEEPRRTSILNVLPARVAEIRGAETPAPVIVLEVGAARLLARVSRRSVAQLGLCEGQAVFAQVKAVAILR